MPQGAALWLLNHDSLIAYPVCDAMRCHAVLQMFITYSAVTLHSNFDSESALLLALLPAVPPLLDCVRCSLTLCSRVELLRNDSLRLFRCFASGVRLTDFSLTQPDRSLLRCSAGRDRVPDGHVLYVRAVRPSALHVLGAHEFPASPSMRGCAVPVSCARVLGVALCLLVSPLPFETLVVNSALKQPSISGSSCACAHACVLA